MSRLAIAASHPSGRQMTVFLLTKAPNHDPLYLVDLHTDPTSRCVTEEAPYGATNHAFPSMASEVAGLHQLQSVDRVVLSLYLE